MLIFCPFAQRVAKTSGKAPAAATARDMAFAMRTTSSVRSSPRCCQGAAAIRSVSASSWARCACPASVSAPSASTRPRARRPASAASHSGWLQPRLAFANSVRNPLPVLVWVTSASMPLRPCAGERGDVTVAAVLAQQRQRVPHDQVRGVGPAQVGVPGVQRAALGGAGAGRLADQPGQREHVDGGDRVLAQQPGQRGVDGDIAGVDDGRRGGQFPGFGDGPGDQRRVEVVEGRGDHAGADRAHRGRPAGEVAHPVAAEPDAGEVVLGLGGEVDQRVQRIGGVVRASGERGGHGSTITA